jgi:helicase
VKLRGIGRVRARRLFNNGITSPAELDAAGVETATKILGRGIAEQLFAQLDKSRRLTSGEMDTDVHGDIAPGQSTLSKFG